MISCDYPTRKLSEKPNHVSASLIPHIGDNMKISSFFIPFENSFLLCKSNLYLERKTQFWFWND